MVNLPSVSNSNFPVWIATDADINKRLDLFVVGTDSSLSRSFVQFLCKNKKILINNTPQKSSYKIKPNDKIIILHDITDPEQIPDINLPIIYEDDDCVVINKPIGLLTHSKGKFNPEPTVATFINSRWPWPNDQRGGIVHRLDRATSGVMIVAKNPLSLEWLQKQFSERKVHKTYIAIIQGELDPPEAIIDMPIQRNPKKPQTFRVANPGKTAQTHYKTITKSSKYSMIELKPTTGRTHQLRVHLQHIGHPIVGDTFYDGLKANRLFLHAKELDIILPNKKRKSFVVPIPSEFEAMQF